MIAIHEHGDSFTTRWIQYCIENKIDYILVDCYSNSVINELKEKRVTALFWHHSHMRSKDIICANSILNALQHFGIRTFPKYHSNWHFDDKIAQKYLAEIFDLPFAKSFSFYDKKEALSFIQHTKFPIVAKLRSGSGSSNVRLLTTYSDAQKYITKSFKRGYRNYTPLDSLKERYRKYRNGIGTFKSVLAGLYRFLVPIEYSSTKGRERGYVLFQEFIPDNQFDIRVVVINRRAFAIKRMVRKNDFRASGAGNIIYDHNQIPLETIRLSLEICQRLEFDCMAFDYVLKNGETPLILEFSYGFRAPGYDKCPGYWDDELNWHPGQFNPYGWIIENMLDCKN